MISPAKLLLGGGGGCHAAGNERFRSKIKRALEALSLRFGSP